MRDPRLHGQIAKISRTPRDLWVREVTLTVGCPDAPRSGITTWGRIRGLVCREALDQVPALGAVAGPCWRPRCTTHETMIGDAPSCLPATHSATMRNPAPACCRCPSGAGLDRGNVNSSERLTGAWPARIEIIHADPASVTQLVPDRDRTPIPRTAAKGDRRCDRLDHRQPVRRPNAAVRYTEFDVFTNTMLAIAVLLAIASGIAAWSNASVGRALEACETSRQSLADCMRSYGYLPIPGGRPGASNGWQSQSIPEFLQDWNSAIPGDDESAEETRL